MENSDETKEQEKIEQISAFYGCNTYNHAFFQNKRI